MREVLYSPAPQATWHHYLHGDLSEDEAGWIARPERRPLLITAEHLRQLGQVIAAGDAAAAPDRPVLSVANLSLGDPDLQAGQGAVAILAHVRIPVTEGDPLRFCHALVAAKRELTPAVLAEALRALSQVMGLDEPADERPADALYLEYLGAESPEEGQGRLQAWLTALDRLLPAAPVYEPSSEWILRGEDVYLPWRLVVHGEADQRPALRRVMGALAAVLYSSALRWSLVTDAPDPHDEREGAVVQVLEGELRASAERTVTLAQILGAEGEGAEGEAALEEPERWLPEVLPLRRARIETYSSFYQRGGRSAPEVVDLGPATPTPPRPPRPPVERVELPPAPPPPPLARPVGPPAAPSGGSPSRDQLLDAQFAPAPPAPSPRRPTAPVSSPGPAEVGDALEPPEPLVRPAGRAAPQRSRRSQVFVPSPPRGDRVRKVAFDDAFDAETSSDPGPAREGRAGGAPVAPAPGFSGVTLRDFDEEGLGGPEQVPFVGGGPAGGASGQSPADREGPSAWAPNARELGTGAQAPRGSTPFEDGDRASVSQALPPPPMAAEDALDPLGIFDPALRRARPRKPPPPTQPWAGEALEGPALLDAPLESRASVDLDPPDRATVVGASAAEASAAGASAAGASAAGANSAGAYGADFSAVGGSAASGVAQAVELGAADIETVEMPIPERRSGPMDPGPAQGRRASGQASPEPSPELRAFAAPPLIPSSGSTERPSPRRSPQTARDTEAHPDSGARGRSPREPVIRERGARTPPPTPERPAAPQAEVPPEDPRRARARPSRQPPRTRSDAESPEALEAAAPLQLETAPDPMIALRRQRKRTLRRYWLIILGAVSLALAFTLLYVTSRPSPGPRPTPVVAPQPTPPPEPTPAEVQPPPTEVPVEPTGAAPAARDPAAGDPAAGDPAGGDPAEGRLAAGDPAGGAASLVQPPPPVVAPPSAAGATPRSPAADRSPPSRSGTRSPSRPPAGGTPGGSTSPTPPPSGDTPGGLMSSPALTPAPTEPPAGSGLSSLGQSSGAELQSLPTGPQPATVTWAPYGFSVGQIESLLLIKGGKRWDLLRTQKAETGRFSVTVVFKGTGDTLSAGVVDIGGDAALAVRCTNPDAAGLPTECRATVTQR